MRASRCRVDFFDRDHRRRFAANIRGGVSSSSSSSVVGFGSIGSVTTTALFSGAVQPAPREEPVEHLMMMSRVRSYSAHTHLFFDVESVCFVIGVQEVVGTTVCALLSFVLANDNIDKRALN